MLITLVKVKCVSSKRRGHTSLIKAVGEKRTVFRKASLPVLLPPEHSSDDRDMFASLARRRPTPVCNEAKAGVELKNSNQLVFSLDPDLV